MYETTNMWDDSIPTSQQFSHMLLDCSTYWIRVQMYHKWHIWALGSMYNPVACLWWSWFPTTGRNCGGALQSLIHLQTSHPSPNICASVTGPHLVIGSTFITAPCKPAVFVYLHQEAFRYKCEAQARLAVDETQALVCGWNKGFTAQSLVANGSKQIFSLKF